MMKYLIPTFFAICSSALGLANERPAKPNILVLLTDDLGWQDVKCYDIDEPSPYQTPNIDALAKKGVMFWRGYSPAPTCAPSRCAIMSGNHPARAQKTHVVGGHPPIALNSKSRMMDPWYSGRMPANEYTLAKALKEEGYVTGHSGKWHIAIDHHAFPQPLDVGFDSSEASRGSRSGMKNRLESFATNDEKDPYRLDENGYPYHQTNEDALSFIKENKNTPFFLYYATWLVHSPIHTRSEERLNKYAEIMDVDPSKPNTKDTPGQKNPFYGAMVEELDYYVGQVFNYLESTDDPRWPGHKLMENTYVIFTSDNGGMEGSSKERYTDNHPLDRGKISAREGGTRVPLIITGPKIPEDIQTNVLANGLDIYPTVLSMAGAKSPKNKNLDGADLYPLLTTNPTDPSMVKGSEGETRDAMMWHFPHGHALESTIIVGDYKLIRKYDHIDNPDVKSELELYQLYNSEDGENGEMKRVDIEESKNLALESPELAKEMNLTLTKLLAEMKASYPSYNPKTPANIPNKEKVPSMIKHALNGKSLTASYKNNGAKAKSVALIYTVNGGVEYEEWHRKMATIVEEGKISVTLPEGTTHYYLNIIDENDFLVSYPECQKARPVNKLIDTSKDKGKRAKKSYITSALKV